MSVVPSGCMRQRERLSVANRKAEYGRVAQFLNFYLFWKSYKICIIYSIHTEIAINASSKANHTNVKCLRKFPIHL